MTDRRLECLLISIGILLIIEGSILITSEKIHEGLVWIPSCTTFGGGHWGLPEYWRGKGIAEPWDSAPDGWYWVQGGWESNNGTVTFPLCPSSGTRLHGTWNCTIYLPDNFQGDVRVQNNVIMERKN